MGFSLAGSGTHWLNTDVPSAFTCRVLVLSAFICVICGENMFLSLRSLRSLWLMSWNLRVGLINNVLSGLDQLIGQALINGSYGLTDVFLEFLNFLDAFAEII